MHKFEKISKTSFFISVSLVTLMISGRNFAVLIRFQLIFFSRNTRNIYNTKYACGDPQAMSIDISCRQVLRSPNFMGWIIKTKEYTPKIPLIKSCLISCFLT